VRKVLSWVGIALGSVAVLLGIEVYLAYTRDYLPTSSPLELGGTFGPLAGRPLTFVVLGDSTAAGLGAGSAENAYASVLSERLGQRGWKVDLLAHGESGARVKDVLIEQTPIAESVEADLAFVGIGANDATHLTSLDSIRQNMAMTLDRLLATGATVVVAGPPDMRAHAWLEPLRSIVGWRGRQIAAAIEDVAGERGVPVVPLAELAGPYFASNPEDAYASDDFHPGSGGYRAWADAIFPVLLEALEERS
jgi:lysophospholipase L1-like esterase